MKEYLKELLELSKKHGIFIVSGDGSCGTTRLEDDQGKELTYGIDYSHEDDIYVVTEITR